MHIARLKQRDLGRTDFTCIRIVPMHGFMKNSDYSCTFTMHVQKKIKLAVGVPYAIMHQNQWFFIGTQIARELENY